MPWRLLVERADHPPIEHVGQAEDQEADQGAHARTDPITRDKPSTTLPTSMATMASRTSSM
jgi:hypothetical protein